jgi:hypothetical protein
VEESRAERWGHFDVRRCAEFFECLLISSDKPEQVCYRVSEFCNEHLLAVVRHGELNGLRRSVESRIHRVLLAPEVCELSEESRLGLCSVLSQMRNEIVGVPPTLLRFVESVKFNEAVDLLRNGGVEIPVVIAISCEFFQISFELLVFCQTRPVVTTIRRNCDEVAAQDNALHPWCVRQQEINGCLDVFEPSVFAVPAGHGNANHYGGGPVF